jgi:RimJ/RimL family protein N-acetyltransferase
MARQSTTGSVIDPESWREVLATPRLRLVPQTAEDADDLVDVLADPALYSFTGGAPLALPALRARLERLQRGLSPDGSEIWGNWVVRRHPDGVALGFVQATIGEQGGDLAWVIGTVWQGQGYAGEAAAALAAFLRSEGVAPITAHVLPAHLASQRVAARAGLRPTGVLRPDGEERWSDEPER